ncbi:hypothetical protein NDU88_000338 [Pleurodeles waltl]|uniref:Uncharacterized protein n=1 Tax=Pleurodeles waltl TaxID=8319 RepID=A0AAV7VT69_PLEWA|nr:hypothetical protein NDU88_000338 [Pleurodeles waltl]
MGGTTDGDFQREMEEEESLKSIILQMTMEKLNFIRLDTEPGNMLPDDKWISATNESRSGVNKFEAHFVTTPLKFPSMRLPSHRNCGLRLLEVSTVKPHSREAQRT